VALSDAQRALSDTFVSIVDPCARLPTGATAVITDVPGLVPGLAVVPGFITEEEEAELVGNLEESGTASLTKGGVKRYSPSAGHATPAFIEALFDRLVAGGLASASMRPDSMRPNGYAPGMSLRAHTDPPAVGDVVNILGLVGDAEMTFSDGRASQTFVFPRRAVVTIAGACRWSPWTHSLVALAPRVAMIFYRERDAGRFC
jgi:hypothetical protein